MAGIQEIARETGLSKSTVSRALRGLPSVAEATVRQVRLAADRVGYVPSMTGSGLATGRNLAIGVLMPVIDRWFYIQVIEGIDHELRAAGYDLVLFNLGGHPGERGRVFHRSILRKRVDALVVLALSFEDDELQELADTEYPAVVVGGPVGGLRHIGIDDFSAGRLATRHLTSLGHRRIAQIGGQDELGLNAAVPQLRSEGFRSALAEVGGESRSDWQLDGRFLFEGGYDAARQLLRGRELPTAVFVQSDEMAFGALAAFAGAGLRVPEDISVVGIDGHEHGLVYGLTTVSQRPAAQGSLAAHTLVRELGGHRPVVAFDPASIELVVRRSTAGPRD